MVSKVYPMKNGSQSNLPKKTIEDVFKSACRFPSTGSVDMNLFSRDKMAAATVSNLVNCGILLPIETDHYRRVLDSYDYHTLFKVLIHSREIRESITATL